ncbi:MAG: SpoIID/LytB domain-containing protein [Thermodesulfobacteriota bacterium]
MDPVEKDLKISVGIMDHQREVKGILDGRFYCESFGPFTGPFIAKSEGGKIALFDEKLQKRILSTLIRFISHQEAKFTIFSVPVGDRFHWERKLTCHYKGDLVLRMNREKTILVINEIPLEEYLLSVIASEMNRTLPLEFLKAHSILSRSWILSAFYRKGRSKKDQTLLKKSSPQEIIRWYDREEHELFDVCSEDHCQRYHGIPEGDFKRVKEAIQRTQGQVLMYHDMICDARYSKACGGLTENFETAWEDKFIPYLQSLSDAPIPYSPIRTEEEAHRWILSEPEAYCNLKDETLLEKILPEVDHQTRSFFRWKVAYEDEELKAILREKSGYDFGNLRAILPLQRGPSGRIVRLKIVGSKMSKVVGKELEIRRWLSRSHLYSSAFIIERKGSQWIFHGAGWGHGVGFCQIGAAAMALQGFSAEEILKHYFTKVEIKPGRDCLENR